MNINHQHKYIDITRCDDLSCEKCYPHEYTNEELMELEYISKYENRELNSLNEIL